MIVRLHDVDSKIPNLALMKISSWHKSQGDTVTMDAVKADKHYASIVFTKNQHLGKLLQKTFSGIDIGGTGWDMYKKLIADVEKMKPDYDLYNIDYGIGFSSRGCVRNCEFCFVPKKEGKLTQDTPISEIINPKSNVVVLLDNNFTADPYIIDKCKEIKERELIVDICQGLDIRLMTEEKAKALSEIKHLKQIHFAWDLMKYEKAVMHGIEVTTKYIKPYRLMCYVLVGFNTTFEEDYYRVMKLRELKIDPFVMVYNQKNDRKLKHFARWVNMKACFMSTAWEDYGPWIREQQVEGQISIA